MSQAEWQKFQIGVTEAARMLEMRVSELKVLINEEKQHLGIDPPKPFYRTGAGGWVFLAGDVAEVAARLKRKRSTSSPRLKH